MPRNRMISPEFWSDEEIGKWSYQARLFYIGLWNFADDKGRFKASNLLLKAQIFPYNRVNIERLKKEIVKKVEWYSVDGSQYGFLRNFLKYQKIDKPHDSKLPPSPTNNSTNNPRIINESSPNIQETVVPNLSQSNLIERNISQREKNCDSFISLLKGLDLRTKDQVGILNTWCSSLKVRGRCQTFDKCKADFFDIVGKVTKQKPKDFSAYLKKAIDNFITGEQKFEKY